MNSRNYLHLMKSEIRWAWYNLLNGDLTESLNRYGIAWRYFFKMNKELYNEVITWITDRCRR